MTGVWMLYPGTITELWAGNVTFPIGALVVAGLRGRAEGIFSAAIVKFSAVAVVPYIWFCRPAARRGLLIGVGVAGAFALVSVLLAPGLWHEYVTALGSQERLAVVGYPIIHLLPTAGADFALRLVIAAVLVVASVRLRSPQLAYVATIVSLPTIWTTRLTLLFALLTLEGDDWVRRLMRRRRGRAAA